MAYCWLRYWDKKRYNQTAIPFFHVSNQHFAGKFTGKLQFGKYHFTGN